MEKEEDGAIELLISMFQPKEFFIKKIICLNKQSMIIMKIINDYDEDNEWWS